MKHFFTHLVGVSLIVIGIISLFLPFLQGIVFITLGLYVLSFRYPVIKNFIDKILFKFPKVKQFIEKNHSRVSSFFL